MAILNEEQTMLREMAENWVNAEAPVTAFRAVRDEAPAIGYKPETYAEMAEMGWAGVIVPEDHGGSDFGYLSLGLVLEETGRNLVASPLTSVAAATGAFLVAGSDEQKAAYLEKIATGELIATLAVDEGPRHTPSKIETTATKDGDAYTLTGKKAFVPEGDSAGLFVVVAKTAAGQALFLVDGDDAGVSRTSHKMVDFRSHADVSFNGAKAQLLGQEDGADAVEQVLDRARIITAAEMLGMAQQSFNTTLEYLKGREQFGEILATFQALQHRMSKLFTDIELARSSVEAALTAIDQGKDLKVLASLAKATMNDTLHLMSREMIQLHGGVGMTDEYDCGFYIKRARVLENAYGNSGLHRERFAQLNGY